MDLTETQKLLAAAVIILVIVGVAYYVWMGGKLISADSPTQPAAPRAAPAPSGYPKVSEVNALGKLIVNPPHKGQWNEYAQNTVCPGLCAEIGPDWEKTGGWWSHNVMSNPYTGCGCRIGKPLTPIQTAALLQLPLIRGHPSGTPEKIRATLASASKG